MVPEGILVGLYVKFVPVQIAAGVKLLVSVGNGFTVTVTVSVVVHPAVVVNVKI